MSKEYKYTKFLPEPAAAETIAGQLKNSSSKALFLADKLDNKSPEEQANVLYSAVRDLGGNLEHPVVKALQAHMAEQEGFALDTLNEIISAGAASIAKPTQKKQQEQAIQPVQAQEQAQQKSEQQVQQPLQPEQPAPVQAQQPAQPALSSLSNNPEDYKLVEVIRESDPVQREMRQAYAKRNPEDFAETILGDKRREDQANIIFSALVEADGRAGNTDVIHALTTYALKQGTFTEADIDNIQVARAELETQRQLAAALLKREEEEIEKKSEPLRNPQAEVPEPAARDGAMFVAADPAKVLASGEIDPITEAIRREILAKQQAILHAEIAKTDPTVANLDSQKFREYLATQDGKEKAAAILAKPEIQTQLNKIEVEGYRQVHSQFRDSFQNVNWTAEPGSDQPSVKSSKIKNEDGQDVATIKETTHNTSPTLVQLENGEQVSVRSYRTIDFPTTLETGKGPLHLSMAAKDVNGRNIAEKDAVYFTAHYDTNGKLTEVSSPIPVKFMGKGDDAVGYIERDGRVFTLPITQGKYKEMMIEVAKNKGHGVDLSQEVAVEAKDRVMTNAKAPEVPSPSLAEVDKDVKAPKKPEQEPEVDPIAKAPAVAEVAIQAQEPLALQIVIPQGSTNTEKGAQIDKALSGASPEQIVATLKDQVKKGGSEVVGLIVDATKPDRVGEHKDVPKLTPAQFKEVYNTGMNAATVIADTPIAAAHTVQPRVKLTNIQACASKLRDAAGITPETHTKSTKANVDKLNDKIKQQGQGR